MARRSPTRWACRIGLTALVVTSLVIGALGQPIEEYQFKAAFLYNMAKFVEWPAESFAGPADPIVTCVLGESPLEAVLEKSTRGRKIGDRGFVVRHLSQSRQAAGCHILFISLSERRRWRSILAEVNRRGLLTVSEIEGFASDGGIVNFLLEDDRVRIEINAGSAEKETLRISAKLLSLPQIAKK